MVIDGNPNDIGPRYNLGRLLAQLGETRQVHRPLPSAALRQEPVSEADYTYLAWMLANSPDPKQRDPKQAVVHAKTAVEDESMNNHDNWRTCGGMAYWSCNPRGGKKLSRALESVHEAPGRRRRAFRRRRRV